MARPTLLYWNSFEGFLGDDPEVIVNRMATSMARVFSGPQREQIDAWPIQLEILDQVVNRLIEEEPAAHEWGIAIEYPLLRLQRRIDAVLIASNAIVVLEFKVKAQSFDNAAVQQAEDYALDLREFHSGSHRRTIIPVLVATHAPASIRTEPASIDDYVWPVTCANAAELPQEASRLIDLAGTPTSPINAREWIESAYKPTPGIIQAARSLYAGHDVREITYASSGVHNLGSTTDAVQETIEWAKAEQALAVCFVTGTPGSGKTLVGLNVVHNKYVGNTRRQAAYLSGTRPLVAVLREALALDHSERTDCSLRKSRHEVRAQVQPLMGYLEEYVRRTPQTPPPENVIVFDEAQRAWDADFGLKRFERPASEPALFLEIMARRTDWAVIVALVGNGQEINKGEGGLAEWGRALIEWAQRSPDRPWSVALSPSGVDSGSALNELWPEEPPADIWIREDARLHLVGSARSHRFIGLHRWVDAVLAGDHNRAAEISKTSGELPIRLTRSLEEARQWLRGETRGNRRCGLVASSGARRLRAYGLGVALRSNDLDETVHWYLKPDDDIRSSHALETTASEYTCQGLELDLVGLCWGGDLLWNPSKGQWEHRRLSGTNWQKIGSTLNRELLRNKYRVLLTRARQETVIWVPSGDATDPTRLPAPLDATASFLESAGARPL